MATGAVPKSIKATLFIDGKPAEASIKNVEQVTRTLERELKGLTVGTEAWNAKMKQVAENKKYLKEVREEINGVGGAFNKIKQELGSLGTLAAGYLGFQFVSAQFQNIILSNAKLSDSLADLRRVTGLTEQGVLNLDASLGKLDTRTSKSGLREIGVIAGKLGVAKNDILEFVEATDKLVVALGDELGNADQVTTQLGKILNVFDGEVNGDNITRLGNAMVKLANDGVASAGFIADFTQRVSGVAKTANLSLGSTLALAAGLEELGARSESSATAIQQLLLSISQDLPAAAAIAKVPLEDFTKLFAQAPEQALLKYTAGLVKNKEAFSEVSASLKSAGEEGARVVSTITALGQKTEFFTEKINTSSEALQGYSEINSAFALKNETLGGSLDRLSKDISKLTSNKTLVDMFASLVNGASATVTWLDRNTETIRNVTKAILISVVAWGAYRLATALATAEKKSWIATLITAETIEKLAILRTTTWGLVTAVLSGNFAKARQELKLLTVMMNANPWGLAIAGVAALGAALFLYSGKLNIAAKIQQSFNDVQLSAKKKLEEETETLKALDAVRTSANSTLEEKIKAITKIRDLYPSILQGLTDEEALTNKGTTAILKYIQALDKQTTAEAAREKITELKRRNLDLQKNKGDVDLGYGEIISGFLSGGSYKSIQMDNRKKELQENITMIAELQNMYGDVLKQDLLGGTEKAGGAGTGGGTGSRTAATASTKEDPKVTAAKKLAAELEKINEELTKNLLSDYDKERFAASLKYQELEKLAGGNKEKLAQIYAAEAAEAEQIDQKYLQKAKEASEKLLEERIKNEKEFNNLKQNLYKSTKTQEEQEEIDAAEAFETQWLMLYEFHQKKVITDAEFAEVEKQLQEKLQNDINAIRDKKVKEQIEKEKKYEEEKNDFIFNSAQAVSDSVFNIISNNQRATSEANIGRLNREREEELSNKNLTEAQKQKINDKYDEKVRQEKRRAWAAEQRAALAQAVINGALAVTKALAQTGVLAPFVIPSILIGTAAQVAVIAAQKAPQFASGGMTDKDPAGFVSSNTLFTNSASGRPFIAGEAGREWIAPNWMLTDPRYSGVIESLEVARKEKRAFAMGGFSNNTQSSTSAPAFNNDNSSVRIDRLEFMMEKMMTAIEKESQKPVVFSQRTFEEENARRVQIKNDASS